MNGPARAAAAVPPGGAPGSPRSAALVHFSGTGGARRVAEAVGQALAARGLEVADRALDSSVFRGRASGEEPLPVSSELLILVFAVHAFDAPEPVYRWLATVEGRGRRAAVLSVSAGGEMWPNTGCRAGSIGALEAAGFEVVYERMLVMPCNWLVAETDDLAIRLIRALPEKAELIADELLAGEIRRAEGRLGPIRRWISGLEKRGARSFGRRIEITAACDGCGRCARQCPEANIALVGGRPRFGENCVMCFRCVYGCPRGALKAHDPQVIPSGFDLGALERRMEGREPAPLEVCCKGLLWLGVRRYLEGREGPKLTRGRLSGRLGPRGRRSAARGGER